MTLRLRDDVPDIRARTIYLALEDAIRNGRERSGFRVVHFSAQGNHIHLIVEAVSQLALTRGMQGLTIRIARAINKAAGRRGKVFADRYVERNQGTGVRRLAQGPPRGTSDGSSISDWRKGLAARSGALDCSFRRRRFSSRGNHMPEKDSEFEVQRKQEEADINKKVDGELQKEKERVIEDERKLNAIVENEGTQPGGGDESGHS